MLELLVKVVQDRYCDVLHSYLSLFSHVINFLSVKLSWSPLCPYLVNSCPITNKTFKWRDEENPAYRNLCGRKGLLISYLGLLSGSPGVKKLRGKILGKTIGKRILLGVSSNLLQE